MQILDDALRSRLLAHHRQLGEKDPDRRLNEDILDRYEEVVNTHFALRQVIQQNLRDHYEWPYGPLPTDGIVVDSTKAKKGKESKDEEDYQSRTSPNERVSSVVRPTDTCLPTPFERLERAERPETPEDALELVNDAIQQVITRYMPDFIQVHDQWLAERSVVEIGNANRAASNFFQPVQSEKGGLSGRVMSLVAVVVIACLTIPFLPGDQFQPGVADDLTPPIERSDQYVLSEEERQVLNAWHDIAKTGRSNSLEVFAHNNYVELKESGIKLIGQAKEWLQRGNTKEATKREGWVRRIGVVLKSVFEDEELLTEVTFMHKPSKGGEPVTGKTPLKK